MNTRLIHNQFSSKWKLGLSRGDKKRIILATLGLFFLLLSVFHFCYSISKSSPELFHSSYTVERYNESISLDRENYDRQIGRKYGPNLIILIKGLKLFFTERYIHFAFRMLLIILYFVIIYFLIEIFLSIKNLFSPHDNNFIIFAIVFLALQYTPAIYNIRNGGAEILLALSVIGHFLFFCRQKYFFAALFIVSGIYFSLFPVCFAVPYFIFSVCSKTHKRYSLQLLLVTFLMALLSLPIAGWKNGFFYPLSMIFSIWDGSSNSNLILVWSREMFMPIAFVNKLINGFHAPAGALEITHTISFLCKLFTVLFIGLTIFSGWKLSRFENKWKPDEKMKIFYFFIFQWIIEVLFFSFSLNTAIAHLSMVMISAFSPLLFLAILKYDAVTTKIIASLAFLMGLSLMGDIIPLTMLCKFLPLAWLNELAGNQAMIPHTYEQYIWYHIPMVGFYIICFVFIFLLRTPDLKRFNSFFL